MNDDPSPVAAALDEQLVAYLDGELDAEGGRRIEALLATDPEVRRRLQSLERTWDLLDQLDTAPVGEPFTHTTLEMVAVAARDEVEHDRAVAPRRRRRRRLAIGGGLLAAAAAGFLTVACLARDPNRQLLKDLPVLVNFDEYRQVENVELLRLLRKEGLFPGESGVRIHAVPPGEDQSLAVRRQFVEGMSPDKKEQLRRAEERFLGLDPAEQQHLRQLHAELQADPDAAKLQAVMDRYCDWLKALPFYDRGELAELPPNERIKRVKRLREEQAREGGRRLGGKDAEALRNWMNECVTRHEASFLKTLPEQQQKKLAEMGPLMRRGMVFGQMWPLWQRGPAADAGKLPPWMTDADLARLRAQLGAEARKRLEDLPTPQQQWEQVAAWIHHGMHLPGAARGMHGPSTNVDDDRLATFFEDLPIEERDRLLSLPGEDMQRQLQRLYLTRTRPPGGPGRRPDGFNRPRRPTGEPPPKQPPEKPTPPKT